MLAQGAASLAVGYALHWAFSPPRVSLFAQLVLLRLRLPTACEARH